MTTTDDADEKAPDQKEASERLESAAEDGRDTAQSGAESDDDIWEDLDPDADDAVIGRALRLSLLAIVAVALVVVVVVLVRPLLRRQAPVRDIPVEAPREVDLPEAEPPALPFEDATASSGIRFVHESGARGGRLLPETMGGGVAFFDYDNDGDQDLLLVNGDTWDGGPAKSGGEPRSALYANDGSGRFADVSRTAGLALRFYGTGVAVGDCDNDGWSDVYLASLFANKLLRNVAAGSSRRFEDVTASAAVAGGAHTWSTSAAFFDADNDGDLDLFVANYVRWSPEIDREVNYQLTGVGRAYGPPVNFEGTFPVFYRNQGNCRFSDDSDSAGVQVRNPATGTPVGKGLAVVPVDVDRDGWMDLVVANDTVQNFYFHNRGDGTFEEQGELVGIAYGRDGSATGAMGIDVGYLRDDGQLAFGIGNFANEMSSLYVAQGDPSLFADESISAGIGAPSRRVLSFGLLFVDLDLDGRLDLLQSNGHLEDEIARVDPSQTYRQQPQLFWNAGDAARRNFVALEPDRVGAMATDMVGRASAFADIDGDGDLDVIMMQTGGRPYLFRNQQATGHHWLRVRAVGNGTSVNASAIGTWIELDVAGRTLRRQVMPTHSYQAQSESVVTFGLGDHDAIDRLEVFWPDGTSQRVADPPPEQTLVVERGS